MSEVITNEDGIGFVKDYTPNLKLAIPYFDIATWHDYIDYNFKALDAVINYIYKIVGFTGDWKNVTTYKVDDIVFINDKNSQYYLKLAKIVVEHTTNSDDFDTFYSNHEEYYEIFDEHILTNGIKIVKINQTLSLSANQPIQINLTSYTNENKSYYCIVNFNQQIDRTKISGICSYSKETRLVTVENFNNTQSSVTVDFIMLIPVDKLVGFNNEINGLTNGLYQTDILAKSSELLAEINNRINGDNSILSYIAELLPTLQEKIDNENKLSSDLVDDTNHINKFVTAEEKSKINNSVQKSGDVMSGTLETTGIITDTLFVRENSTTTVAILSASIANSQIYFGNINYTTYLRGSSLKYIDPTGTNYDIHTSQGFIQDMGGWTWQYDEDLQKYYAQIDLSSYIPYTGKKYLILFSTTREDFWKYLNTYGNFVNTSTRRRLNIYFDQQLYTDLHTSNPGVEFTVIPLDSSFTRDFAIFVPTASDVADEWWENNDYPSNTYPQKTIDKLLIAKQDTLVSGTNIKTVNGNSLLGSGDIEINGGGSAPVTFNMMTVDYVQVSGSDYYVNVDVTSKFEEADTNHYLFVVSVVADSGIAKYLKPFGMCKDLRLGQSTYSRTIKLFFSPEIINNPYWDSSTLRIYVAAFPIADNNDAIGSGGVIVKLMNRPNDTSIPDYIYNAEQINSTFQTQSNLVTSVDSTSTNSQYPSAKLFYDTCGDIETLINAL